MQDMKGFILCSILASSLLSGIATHQIIVVMSKAATTTVHDVAVADVAVAVFVFLVLNTIDYMIRVYKN